MRVLVYSFGKLREHSILAGLDKYVVCDRALAEEECLRLSDYTDYDALIIAGDQYGPNTLELCEQLRSNGSKAPIALLSSQPSSAEKVYYLSSGVDIYLPHDVSMDEFRAELMVLLRRDNLSQINASVRFKGFCLDLYKRILFFDDRMIFLRSREYDLLEYLALNIGKVLTKEQLLEHVWDRGLNIPSNTLEVHIRSLRLRFKEYTEKEIITTIKNKGYLLLS